jgi:hypothetical protein
VKIGTKSVLFGAHQFLIHPLFVAWAWWKLYGFPHDPRLWVAFFVHDLGYLGKPNMDGPEGERHVEFGAAVMHFLFDRPRLRRYIESEPGAFSYRQRRTRWRDFCLYHSRFYAKRDGRPHSRLCVADKLAIVLTPGWLYLPMARATGEIHEYMDLAKARTEAGEPKYVSMNIYSDRQSQWYANVQEYLRRWVDEHKDGRTDTWTPTQRQARDAHGVWQ